jgi:hypothetical protein
MDRGTAKNKLFLAQLFVEACPKFAIETKAKVGYIIVAPQGTEARSLKI